MPENLKGDKKVVHGKRAPRAVVEQERQVKALQDPEEGDARHATVLNCSTPGKGLQSSARDIHIYIYIYPPPRFSARARTVATLIPHATKNSQVFSDPQPSSAGVQGWGPGLDACILWLFPKGRSISKLRHSVFMFSPLF